MPGSRGKCAGRCPGLVSGLHIWGGQCEPGCEAEANLGRRKNDAPLNERRCFCDGSILMEPHQCRQSVGELGGTYARRQLDGPGYLVKKRIFGRTSAVPAKSRCGIDLVGWVDGTSWPIPSHGRKARDGDGRRATGSEHACPRLDEAVVWHPLERTPFASRPRCAGLPHAPARRSPEDTHPMHDVSISRFPAVRRSRPRPIWFCPSAVCSRSLHSGSLFAPNPNSKP